MTYFKNLLSFNWILINQLKIGIEVSGFSKATWY